MKRIVLPALAGLVLVTATSTGAQDSAQAWLGVQIQNLDRSDERRLDLRAGTRGVLVVSVVSGSPADRAGVRADDLLTQLDGRTVGDRSALLRVLDKRQPGDKVRLTLLRNGRTRSVEVALGSRPEADVETAADVLVYRGPEGGWRRALGLGPRLGVEVLDLDADLGAYFGVGAGEGVLVTRVQPRSGAADAGLKAGDVLQRLNDRDVRRIADLHEALDDLEAGDRVRVGVRRHGRDETLDVELVSAGFEDRMPRALALPRFDVDREALQRELRELRRELEDMRRELRALRR